MSNCPKPSLHKINSQNRPIGKFLSSSNRKESACNVGDLGSLPGSRRSLEKGMATHSSILAWRIPRTEAPGGRLSLYFQNGPVDGAIAVGNALWKSKTKTKNTKEDKKRFWILQEKAMLFFPLFCSNFSHHSHYLIGLKCSIFVP